MAAAPSYAHGASERPLLGETIGENLERTVAAQGTATRSSSPPGRPLDYQELSDRTTASRAGCSRRHRRRRSGGDLVAQLRRVVVLQYASARSARSSSTSTRPKDRRARVRAASVRVTVLFPAAAFGLDYAAMVAEVRGGCRRSSASCSSTRRLGRAARAGDDVDERGAARRGRARIRRPDQHPVHERHHRLPKGATLTHHNILNNGFYVGGAMPLTERDRVCMPVPFYHCFGMVMGNLGVHDPRRRDGLPGAGFDAASALATVARRALHGLYGVPTMFIAELDQPRSPSSTSARCAPASWPARRARSR